MSSEEEALNTKRMMEQSVPFHSDSALLRSIFCQKLGMRIIHCRLRCTEHIPSPPPPSPLNLAAHIQPPPQSLEEKKNNEMLK